MLTNTADVTQAMVMRAPRQPLVAEALQLAPLTRDLVRVRVRAVGVCRSDLAALEGHFPMDPPVVLGHEACGEVVAVGPEVRFVEPGDTVVLSWLAPCGRCPQCVEGRGFACSRSRSLENLLPDGSSPLTRTDDTPVWPLFGVGGFSETVIVPESAAITVDPALPAPIGALIGCCVATGVGAVRRTARVRLGQSAVVVGCGGVGLSVVAGLRLAGAHPIVAVDLSPDRRARATRLGATTTLAGDDPAVADTVRDLTGGGADFVFDATGNARVVDGLLGYVGQGGTAVVVGMPGVNEVSTFSPFDLADQSKRIIGSNYGSSVPAADFPLLARLYLDGRLPLDELIGGSCRLEDVNRALDDVRAGAGLRTVITMEDRPT